MFTDNEPPQKLDTLPDCVEKLPAEARSIYGCALVTKPKTGLVGGKAEFMMLLNPLMLFLVDPKKGTLKRVIKVEDIEDVVLNTKKDQVMVRDGGRDPLLVNWSNSMQNSHPAEGFVNVLRKLYIVRSPGHRPLNVTITEGDTRSTPPSRSATPPPSGLNSLESTTNSLPGVPFRADSDIPEYPPLPESYTPPGVSPSASPRPVQTLAVNSNDTDVMVSELAMAQTPPHDLTGARPTLPPRRRRTLVGRSAALQQHQQQATPGENGLSSSGETPPQGPLGPATQRSGYQVRRQKFSLGGLSPTAAAAGEASPAEVSPASSAGRGGGAGRRASPAAMGRFRLRSAMATPGQLAEGLPPPPVHAKDAPFLQALEI